MIRKTGEAERPGSWVRQQREAAGMTREELAAKSGLSVRAISDLERGQTARPYPRSIRLLASALGLSPATSDQLITWYRTGSEDETPVQQTPGHAASSPERPPAATPASPGSSPGVVPRQLPTVMGQFTGRSLELKILDGLLETARSRGNALLISISGTAGVGKTALAVQWGHRLAEEFPDGQLYANLRGFDPSGAPVTPEEAIQGFLEALQVSPERIPSSLNAQVGLYRSLMAGKRMIVVLDNARDAAQVRPLLSGTREAGLVVVTSRSRLTGLVAAEGACPLDLDVLTEDEARELLVSRLGEERVADEPEAVAELIGLCARLPLALAVTAARAASSRAQQRLSILSAELGAARERLDMLATGDTATDVRAVFSWSRQNLGADAARMFWMLGLHPGPDISLPAAASLAGITSARARRALRELTDAHLLDEYLPGRFAFHDLLRAYAAELAADDDNNADRAQVIGRFLSHYLHSAHAATRLLDPGRDLLPLEQAPGETTPEVFTSYAGALSWFESERPVLLAVIRLASEAGFDYTAAYLPATLTDFLYLRGYWHDLTAIQRTALDAARRGGDVAAEALAHRNLARSHFLNSNYADARTHYERALELYRGLGDHIGQARTHSGMSHVWRASGQDDAALSHGEQALFQFRKVGHREGQAIALNDVGWSHARLGDYQQALTCCAEGLDLCRELGDRHSEAATWDTLGYARHRLGDYREAIACFQQALAIFRDVSDRYNESDTLINLGDSSHALGDTRAARDAWQRALGILHDLGHRRASVVESRLDGLLPS